MHPIEEEIAATYRDVFGAFFQTTAVLRCVDPLHTVDGQGGALLISTSVVDESPS